MRLPCALPILVLVACGDDGASVDDAGGDPDGATPTPARVWTVGDVFIDGELVAVRDDGVRIPAAGGLYATGTSPSPHVFSASATHVAYVASDGSVHVARADGSADRTVVNAEANVETPALALSPDGTQLAFLRDALGRDNQFDVRVWRDAASFTVTPARSAPDPALRPAELLAWSPDGRYLGFTGDFTEDGYEQAYVVDTQASTPAPVALVERAEIAAGTGLGTRGVVGALQFDRAGQIYFRGRIETGSQFRLYRATASGAGSRTVVPMPARSNGAVPDVGPFAIAPDGARLAVAVDAPMATAYDVHVVALDTLTANRVTALTSAGRPSLVQPMWISPDGSTLALVGDYLTAGTPSVRNEPYVVALDGSTPQPRRLVQVGAACGSCDASTLQWGASAVYALGDLLVQNETETYVLDPTTADQTPSIARDFADMRDAIGLTVR